MNNLNRRPVITNYMIILQEKPRESENDRNKRKLSNVGWIPKLTRIRVSGVPIVVPWK